MLPALGIGDEVSLAVPPEVSRTDRDLPPTAGDIEHVHGLAKTGDRAAVLRTRVLAKQGKHEEAIDRYRALIEETPDASDLHLSVAHALKTAIAATQDGRPALLEFMTTKTKIYSTFQAGYQAQTKMTS